jgi:hypothetical protein
MFPLSHLYVLVMLHSQIGVGTIRFASNRDNPLRLLPRTTLAVEQHIFYMGSQSMNTTLTSNQMLDQEVIEHSYFGLPNAMWLTKLEVFNSKPSIAQTDLCDL